jgi:probable F420-dependent oxidoreductase
MKFMVMYPLATEPNDGAWLDPETMMRFARAVEAAGLDGIGLTDHPAPSKKWLDGGGHETLDPFVGLATFAAATTRIRLVTHLIVVPYRNPLLLAKSMTSLDVVSGGRATYVLGTGYLRSEFAALGVDFTERNELFDEAIEVLQGIWATDALAYEGRHFTAVGATMTPGPVQRPHPPLWVGGNSTMARDRVARWGQGWSPMQGSPVLARTARTAVIESDDDLVRMIADLAERLAAHGRSVDDIDIHASSAGSGAASTEPRIDALSRLSEVGVTWSNASISHTSVSEALEQLQQFGEEVVAKLG